MKITKAITDVKSSLTNFMPPSGKDKLATPLRAEPMKASESKLVWREYTCQRCDDLMCVWTVECWPLPKLCGRCVDTMRAIDKAALAAGGEK